MTDINWQIGALAFGAFRHDFGVLARPEDHPTLWSEYVDWAAGVILEEEELVR